MYFSKLTIFVIRSGNMYVCLEMFHDAGTERLVGELFGMINCAKNMFSILYVKIAL